MQNDPSQTAPTLHQDIDGIRFTYRRFGAADGVPLVFLQHFAGTMDSWDPNVVDGFARARPVILLDDAGVGSSGGTTPKTVHAMAHHALAFLAALRLRRVDLLGFSLGGFIAQVMAALRPELVRRMILAGTGPQGGVGIANVMVVSVLERRREIGVRRALGATRGEIVRYFLFENLLLTSFGLGLGLALAIGLNHVLRRIMTELRLGPEVILLSMAIFVGTGLLSALVPARRAALIPPWAATRTL